MEGKQTWNRGDAKRSRHVLCDLDYQEGFLYFKRSYKVKLRQLSVRLGVPIDEVEESLRVLGV